MVRKLIFLEKNKIKTKIDIIGVVLHERVKTIEVMLAPSLLRKYKRIFSLKGISIKIISTNVQK